ncbi:hypothetical protein GIB67_012274 [Kingdonia uniflora]|uniref:Uncharacterized protein n=1 Tax=Kingdonia uniflora TaxID=39325 RepID=A0A7J7LG04_9MAGN|nr:hypothetical protein GIB67_012274 [Kingdonia uniflora]
MNILKFWELHPLFLVTLLAKPLGIKPFNWISGTRSNCLSVKASFFGPLAFFFLLGTSASSTTLPYLFFILGSAFFLFPSSFSLPPSSLRFVVFSGVDNWYCPRSGVSPSGRVLSPTVDIKIRSNILP